MGKRSSWLMVDEDDPQWLRFWNAYPKRVSKKNARQAWATLNPSPTLVDTMIEALAWQSQQPQWLKDGGQYAPFPATWLNGEKWDDECPAHLKPRAEWQCPHVERCNGPGACGILLKLDPSGARYTQRRKAS